MPILDLYEHGEQRKNLAHFATLASLAAVDGVISEKEKEILDKFAFRLNITDAEYKEVMKKENKYPIETPHSGEKRLKRLFDFFGMAFADNNVDEEQMSLIVKYAVGLGYSPEKAVEIVKKSIAIFTGKIAFEDYQYLMDK
ncbi:TerB family tellurite resistance protein [Flagellimonas hymeniacidonis]|uniref:TerB family tellurite resistance protein n=1 Tax=Flagellimonas hymeniacidonis TaxID=2603628 RepID=A0A5C8V7L8_9FLAO|nr:TerB family tellurite resistance protein [Flagellimonas hymeniacidonis]TXN37336.1 TerB family tellurite resistance protein [Flagellimonas hymeniacidonis]